MKIKRYQSLLRYSTLRQESRIIVNNTGYCNFTTKYTKRTKTYMELNMERSAVNANPIANILFIFTRDKSRLEFFSLSSSRSIFRFCWRSILSPWTSFFFSTVSKNTNLANKYVFPSLSEMNRGRCFVYLFFFFSKLQLNFLLVHI